MNTVADKLMKLVQTKSDIRQALLDKGFNVPDTMPFSGYADLIRRFPCNAKDFPDIPGMIARWSAKGLTNEDMSTNPVWKDLMGNGYDLQMKNFLWGGMSGVGGYVENYNRWVKSAVRADITFTDHSFNVTSVKINQAQFYYQSSGGEQPFTVPSGTVIVKGLTDGQVLEYIYTDIEGRHVFTVKNDGIYTLPSFEFIAKGDYYGFQFNKVQESCNITIEQLPLYPGALVFDGVDDCGVCDNFPILTKEKGYTVVALRKWIARDNRYEGLVSNIKNWNQDGAFLLEYKNKTDYTVNFGYSNPITISDYPIVYQTSKYYNDQKISHRDDKLGSNALLVGKLAKNGFDHYSNFALYSLVILDHDATEEELQKIQEYYKQEYPWLFPDQAWTVTGKTNEDEDRATIANITGNGNDLILSNFGFAGNSGYGLYAENYAGGRWVQSTDRADLTWTSYSVNITSVKVASTQLYYQSYPEQPSFIVPSYKIKVYGLKDGQTLSYRQATSEGQQLYKISEDGTYTLPSFPFKANGDWYGFTLNKVQESCDITIEQIPEYEGYLVTDGVDDSGRAVNVTTEKDFTLVGEWKLFSDTSNNAGLSIHPQIHIFNRPESIQITFRSAGKTLPVKSLKAICSDGRCYDKDWNELHINVGNFTNNTGTLFVGSNGGNYTKTAFKNLSLYNNQIFSKEDCIKAYNYLQTLKS